MNSIKNYVLAGVNLTFLATVIDAISDWLGIALLIISCINAVIPLMGKFISNIKRDRYSDAVQEVHDIVEAVEDTIEQVSEMIADDEEV